MPCISYQDMRKGGEILALLCQEADRGLLSKIHP